MKREMTGGAVLLVVVDTANTGSGGVREGGQGGKLPPVKHAEAGVESEREEVRACVAAEHAAQWKWTMGEEGVSQGNSGVEGVGGSVRGCRSREELGCRVRIEVIGDSSTGQIEGRRGTQLQCRGKGVKERVDGV